MSNTTYDSQPLHLRFPNERDETMVIDLTLIRIADDVDALSRGGNTFGYIRRVGRVFVALTGGRFDHAVECCQSLLWDKAAWALLEEAEAHRPPKTVAEAGRAGHQSDLHLPLESLPVDHVRQAQLVLVA